MITPPEDRLLYPPIPQTLSSRSVRPWVYLGLGSPITIQERLSLGNKMNITYNDKETPGREPDVKPIRNQVKVTLKQRRVKHTQDNFILFYSPRPCNLITLIEKSTFTFLPREPSLCKKLSVGLINGRRLPPLFVYAHYSYGVEIRGVH